MIRSYITAISGSPSNHPLTTPNCPHKLHIHKKALDQENLTLVRDKPEAETEHTDVE